MWIWDTIRYFLLTKTKPSGDLKLLITSTEPQIHKNDFTESWAEGFVLWPLMRSKVTLLPACSVQFPRQTMTSASCLRDGHSYSCFIDVWRGRFSSIFIILRLYQKLSWWRIPNTQVNTDIIMNNLWILNLYHHPIPFKHGPIIC